MIWLDRIIFVAGAAFCAVAVVVLVGGLAATLSGCGAC